MSLGRRPQMERLMADKRIARMRLKRGRYKSVVGEFYGTPKEVWGFRTARAAAPSTQLPERAARGRHVAALTRLFRRRRIGPL